MQLQPKRTTVQLLERTSPLSTTLNNPSIANKPCRLALPSHLYYKIENSLRQKLASNGQEMN